MKNSQINIRIQESLLEDLKDYCKKERISQTQVITAAIKSLINKNHDEFRAILDEVCDADN